MSISVLQSVVTDGTGSAATTITGSITTTANPGTLHVFLGVFDGVTISSLADGTNTYTLLDAIDDSSHSRRAAHYEAHGVAPGTYTVTGTFSSSSNQRSLVIKEITGATNATADKHAGQLQATPTTTTDATTSGATATLAQQPALVSGFCQSTQYSSPTDSAGTGFTTDSSTALTAGGMYIVGESKRVTATTGVAATFTSGSNFAHISFVAVFDEAGVTQQRSMLTLGAG